jgi:nicotinamidase-related amidase
VLRLPGRLGDADDVIIEKLGYGAFHGTPLADLLRGRGVESLLITGT